jgi:hypothetical protein
MVSLAIDPPHMGTQTPDGEGCSIRTEVEANRRVRKPALRFMLHIFTMSSGGPSASLRIDFATKDPWNAALI